MSTDKYVITTHYISPELKNTSIPEMHNLSSLVCKIFDSREDAMNFIRTLPRIWLCNEDFQEANRLNDGIITSERRWVAMRPPDDEYNVVTRFLLHKISESPNYTESLKEFPNSLITTLISVRSQNGS